MVDLTPYILEHNVNKALEGNVEAALAVQRSLHDILSSGADITSPAMKKYLLHASARFLEKQDTANDLATSFAQAYGIMKPRGRPKADTYTEYKIADFVVEKKTANLTMEDICAEYNTSELAKELQMHMSIENLQRIYDKYKDLVAEIQEQRRQDAQNQNDY